MEYIHRTVEEVFLRLNKVAKIMLVTGARQVGKTTLLRHLAGELPEKFNYVTMDDLVARDLAKHDPILFLQQYRSPLIIDEVQYAPELFPVLKQLADASEDMGQYWLTGSQQFQMMQKVSESLAGRVRMIELSSFSYNELAGIPFAGSGFLELETLMEQQKSRPKTDITDVYKRIWFGGMPAIQAFSGTQGIEINSFFDAYVNTYLMRDAMELGNIKNIVEFRKFINACALLIGQQLNYKTLADHVGITQKTAKDWLSLLESMHILYLLPPFANNRLKRLAKTPKLYFKDTGLLAWLLNETSPQTLMQGPFSGNIFENYVILEIYKNLTTQQSRLSFSYYRDSNGKEIDLLIEMDGKIHPIEIKKAAMPKRTEVNKFGVLEQGELPVGAGGIVCMVPEVVAIDGMNCFVPVGLI